MARYDDDDPPPEHRARSGDPDTSHAAAASVSAEMTNAHFIILMGTIQRYGPGTMYEIRDRCDLDLAQIHKRLPEMEGPPHYWLCRPGWSTKGPTGRQCKVWYECLKDCPYRDDPPALRRCDLPAPYED